MVGKGYHTDEKVVGFYNAGDRIKFWRKNGTLWGGLWGWLFGALFMMIPGIGHVVVLGYLATMVVSAAEGAIILGALTRVHQLNSIFAIFRVSDHDKALVLKSRCL